MAVTTFAAIDVGSYDISMKIFELSRKVGFRELNDVRFRLEIGHEAYSTGKLDPDMVDAICEILLDFRRIMREFGAEEYRACAHGSFRALVNPVIVVEQIFQRTGIRIDILSNAEQHFLGYKSIAAIETGFKKMIQKGTAIMDVGGGSLQVSLFDKDALVTTQNLKMGSLMIRERLKQLEKTTIHYDQLVEEFIRNDLMSFSRLYLKGRTVSSPGLSLRTVTRISCTNPPGSWRRKWKSTRNTLRWRFPPWSSVRTLWTSSTRNPSGRPACLCWTGSRMTMRKETNISRAHTISKMISS